MSFQSFNNDTFDTFQGHKRKNCGSEHDAGCPKFNWIEVAPIHEISVRRPRCEGVESMLTMHVMSERFLHELARVLVGIISWNRKGFSTLQAECILSMKYGK